jgi:hypothetical protein
MRTPHCTRTPWSVTPPPDPFREGEARRALQPLRLPLARSAFLGRSFWPRRRYASPGLLLWCRRLLGWHEANLLHRWVVPICGTLLWYLKSMLTEPGPRRKAERIPTRKQKQSSSETMRHHSSASPGPVRPVLPLALESAPTPPAAKPVPPRPAPAPSVEAKPDLFCQPQRRTNQPTLDTKFKSRPRKPGAALIVEAKPIPIVARRAVPRSEEPSSASRTHPRSGGPKKRSKMAENQGRCPPQAMPSTPESSVTSRRQRRQGVTHGEASPVRSPRHVEPSSARSPRSAVGSSRLSPGLSREHDERRKRRKTEESGHFPISAGKKLQIRLQELICQAISGNRRSQDELIRSIASLDQQAKSQRRSGRRAEKKRENWESLADLPHRPRLTKPSQRPPLAEPARRSELTNSSHHSSLTTQPTAVQGEVTAPRAVSLPRRPAIHRPVEMSRNGRPLPLKSRNHPQHRGWQYFPSGNHHPLGRLTLADSTSWFGMTPCCHKTGDTAADIVPSNNRLMIARRRAWMHEAGKIRRARPPPQENRHGKKSPELSSSP